MHRSDYVRRAGLESVLAEDLRNAMRQLASGVTLVTAERDDELFGITVTAFASISLEPPIVMASINAASSICDSILSSEHFGVHLLEDDHRGLSELFASSAPGAEKYIDLAVARGATGAPLIDGTLARLECALTQTLAIGSHICIFGRVVGIAYREEPGSPLIYYHRAYRRLESE